MDTTHTTAASPSPPQVNGRLCRQCQDWLIGPRDSYCSGCGRLQLPVAMVPERVPLNLLQDRSRMLVFSNDGPQPVTFEVLAKGGEVPWIQFEAPRERTLEPGKKDSMKVWLEEKDFPKGLTIERFVYQCRIDKKPNQALEFVVEVTGPPRPELRPAFLDFGQVVAGQSVRRELEITNRGGTMLVLQKLEVTDAPELQVDQTVNFPVPIDVDRRFTLPVIWNPAVDDDSSEATPPREGEVNLIFGHSPTPITVRARATTERRLLSVEPREIRIEQALPKYDEVRTLKLENKGTVALTLQAPAPSVPWIEIEAPAPAFQLASPHSPMEPHGKGNPPLVGPDCELTLRLSPRKAGGPGHYQSEIHFGVAGNGSLPLLSVPITLNVLTPRPYRGSVGIDFGTTNSVVALQDLDSREVTLATDLSLGEQQIPTKDAHLIPSVLVLGKLPKVGSTEPNYSIGRRAQREAPASPGRTVRAVKRLLGSSSELRLDGQEFKPEDIASLIVRRLIEYAERHLLALHGRAFEIREAVITVPSAFFDAQIQAIEKACRSAGISIGLSSAPESRGALGGAVLYEPVAAALFFIQHLRAEAPFEKVKRPKGLNMLIYDHGGGTLDLALVRVTSSRANRDAWIVEVLATAGSALVGGDTLDRIIAVELLCRLQLRDDLSWLDPKIFTISHSELMARAQRESWPAHYRDQVLVARDEWRTIAESAKIALSNQDPELNLPSDQVKVEIQVPSHVLIGLDSKRQTIQAKVAQAFTLTRSDCNANFEKHLRSCADLTRRTIRIARLKAEQVDYVIHAGRQSLMPEIRKRIQDVFNLSGEQGQAHGKASYAHNRLYPDFLKVCVGRGAALYSRLRNTGAGGISLANSGQVLPFSYGRKIIRGGIFEDFEVLVPIGTPYPTTKPIVCSIPEKQLSGPVLRLDLWQNGGEGSEIPSPEVRHLSMVELKLPDIREGGIILSLEVDARRQLVISTEVDRVEVQAEALEEDPDEWIG
jgi:molecular chaperone DnaK (HSP70)